MAGSTAYTLSGLTEMSAWLQSPYVLWLLWDTNSFYMMCVLIGKIHGEPRRNTA